MAFSNYWAPKISSIIRHANFPEEHRCKLIVEISGRRTEKIISLIEANKGHVHHELGLIPALAAELPYSACEELARSQHVLNIWDDTPVYAFLDSSQTDRGEAPRNESGYTGKGVVVAILDTGIYPHEDLISPENRILAWNDLIKHRNAPYDDNGHGTNIAGIIAGNGILSDNKFLGVAPETRLVGVKVLNQDGIGSLFNVLKGIEWCIDNLPTLKIKVLNLSLGSTAQGSYEYDPLARATTAAWQNGIVVCSTINNTSQDFNKVNSPFINPRIITIANFDNQQTLSIDDKRLRPSLNGSIVPDNLLKPNLTALGTNLSTLNTKDGYDTISGNSAATALVSGAIALILEKSPFLRPYQVKNLLINKAKDIGLGVYLQGEGVLDFEKLFKKAKQRPNNTSIQSPGNQVFKSLIDLMNPTSSKNSILGNEFLLKLLMSFLNNLR